MKQPAPNARERQDVKQIPWIPLWNPPGILIDTPAPITIKDPSTQKGWTIGCPWISISVALSMPSFTFFIRVSTQECLKILGI